MGEESYIALIKKLLSKHASGDKRVTRNDAVTIAVFGRQLRFDISNGIVPLMTSRRVFWRGITEELLWFIRGSTNANDLKSNNIHIWDGHSSRKHLDKTGLDYEEGVIGPMYGHQWRNAGGTYDPDGKNRDGIDQLQNVIDLIKTDPMSRRIVMNNWSVTDLGKSALAPCHVLAQFFVDGGKLSCSVYIRSSDVAIGLPFNIASYALLTHIIAKLTGLETDELIVNTGDTHIYESHVEGLEEQVDRTLYHFPTVVMPEMTSLSDVERMTSEDFKIENYHFGKSIKMKMVV